MESVRRKSSVVPPATPEQKRRRIIFAAAACLQTALFGTVYAFPLWLVHFKTLFSVSQLQANLIGVALYVSVSLIGIPFAPLILSLISPLVASTLCHVLLTASFTTMYFVSNGSFGYSNSGFTVLIVAIVVAMAALGVSFSLCLSILMREDMYGKPNVAFVNGLINVMFALGGVVAGCLFYFSTLSLANNMLIIAICGGVSLPVMFLGVFISTRKPRPSYLQDEEHVVPDTEGESESTSVAVVHTEKTPLILVNDENTHDGNVTINDGPQKAAGSAQKQEGLCEFLRITLTSWRYYHVGLLILLKVGIGATFTTNIGTAIEASLPKDASPDYINDRVSFSIIMLNFAQLLGRLSFTLLALVKGNPNKKTISVIMFVATVYMASFAARLTVSFSYVNLVIILSVFGVAYGMMWCTTGGLVPFLPRSNNVPRVLAMTQPWGSAGNITLNLLAGLFYDQHTSGGNSCYGHQCYYKSDMVMIGVSAGLFFISALRLYQGVPDTKGRWPEDKPKSSYGPI